MFCYETHQAVSLVIDHLVAQGSLGKSPHLVVGQQLILQSSDTQEHIPVGVPVVKAGTISLILGCAFGKPHRHHRAGKRIGDNPVWVAGEDILSFLCFVVEPLEVETRHPAGTFSGYLEGDNVGKLVGDHIPQPVMRAPEFEIHGRDPDLDLVVIVIGCPIGIVLVIFKYDVNLSFRLKLVKRGDRPVDLLRNL